MQRIWYSVKFTETGYDDAEGAGQYFVTLCHNKRVLVTEWAVTTAAKLDYQFLIYANQAIVLALITELALQGIVAIFRSADDDPAVLELVTADLQALADDTVD